MHYDTIIIGAGTMGMAAGYFLAKQGKNVLLLDAFNPPHDQGSHHGETRIIRFAYGEGKAYVPLALRALDLWQELEKISGKQLFLKTGVLNIGSQDLSFIQNVIESAKDFNLSVDVYSAEEVNKKWPGITLPEGFIGCFEPSAGVLRVEACIDAYKTAALSEGATLKTNARVVKITPGKIVSVHTEEDVFSSDSIIISAGARVNDILKSVDLTLPITPLRKTFAWFNADEATYGDPFPAFTYEDENSSYYGFPSIDGAGFKIGRHDSGDEVSPDDVIREFGETDAKELVQFNERIMPQVGSLKYGKTCFYSKTPDEDFIIDSHPIHDNIFIAAGFSGHGFKFGSVIGEILSQLVLNGKSELDIRLFKLTRF